MKTRGFLTRVFAISENRAMQFARFQGSSENGFALFKRKDLLVCRKITAPQKGEAKGNQKREKFTKKPKKKSRNIKKMIGDTSCA